MARARSTSFTQLVLWLIIAVVAVLGGAQAAQAAPKPGVNTHLMWSSVDATKRDQQIQWAKEAGVQVMRIDVGWASLQENGPDRYSSWYVTKLDAVVNAVESAGIKPILTLAASPCWASSAPETKRQSCAGAWWDRDVMRYAPSNPADYARALTWLVKRFGTRAAAYEIWNEPNLDEYLLAADPVKTYTELVKVAYPAAKAAAPDATIIVGATQGADFHFAQGMFDHGLGSNLDGFSIHPYTGEIAPSKTLSGDNRRWSFVQGPPLVRDTLAANGAGSKKVWITEAGWSVNKRRGGEIWENGVSEATQAAYVKEAFDIAAGWDFVEALVWYSLVDDRNDPNDVWGTAGLRRYDGTARPAFTAFKDAAGGIASGPGTGASTLTAPTGTKPLALDRAEIYSVSFTGSAVVVAGKAPVGSKVAVTVAPTRPAASNKSRRKVVRANSKGRFKTKLRARGKVRVRASVVRKRR